MVTDDIRKIPDGECGVSEEKFPCLGRCFKKNKAIFMESYEKICPYCDISTSLPYRENLKTVTIFECSIFGYGTRVTE
ncbi:MAG TPA: hypothetical protein DCS12_06895 [Clostridiales bacterium]|mgnify:CR=1 FL=1|jgi:hypothetical protein|nr:hypothetical protein [Clostridiales bacterium]